MSAESVSLADAVAVMADRLATVDTGETWGGFTCAEIESIADVLRIGGHDDVADFIISEHAIHDEDGDAHFGGQS